MLESWRVVVRYCFRWLLAIAVLTWSALATASGLGEITLHSALNQPLRADIALVDAAGLQEGELSVRLATAQEFDRAGVERVLFLDDLKFTPVLRGNRSLIQVTSSRPVNEPFLNFLLQLNQPNGRVLREYTVLIDPPGTQGIEPASDETLAGRSSSAFANEQPAMIPAEAPKESPLNSASPARDVLAGQLAASVLQIQQSKASIDELKAKLQAADEQIAAQKKQVAELQARLAEVKPAQPEPLAPNAVAPVPMVIDEPGTNWLLIGGLLALVALLALLIRVRRQRQQDEATFVSAVQQSPLQAPLMDNASEPTVSACAPQPVPIQNWDLDPMVANSSSAKSSSAPTLLEPEINWQIEPVAPSLDGSFIAALSEPVQTFKLEPLNLEPTWPSNAGKLEQAQTRIDENHLESVIELLEDADEPLKQTTRSLPAGIR